MVRGELTDILQGCPEDQHLTGPIRAMRAACRKFLDQMGHPSTPSHRFLPYEAGMWEALGELRGAFGIHLARLCAAYGVDMEPELGSILPNSDLDTDDRPDPTDHQGEGT